MTLQAINGSPFPHPTIYGLFVQGNMAFSLGLFLDASAEKAAFVFEAPASGNIARIGFRLGTVATGGALRVSLQNVSATTGDPDGVVDQFRIVTVLDTNDNTWIRTELITSDGTDSGALRAVSRGDRLAVVFDFASYVAQNLNVSSLSNGGYAYMGLPYSDHFTAAWAKAPLFSPIVAVEYADGTFPMQTGLFPWSAATSTAFNSTSSPDEIALRFTVPVPMKVKAAWISANILGDAEVILYDASSVVLASASIDKDIRGYNGGAAIHHVHLSAEVELAALAVYRLAIKPMVTSPSTVLPHVFVHANANLGAVDGGMSMYWSQRTDSGPWTDIVTQRILAGVIPSALDDGVAVSSGGNALSGSLLNAGVN